ncbi:ABC transporter permease [Bacillus alkalicellulosilyticus]|uniref:ABC transporter permease n=1 Tax=Alkalihalobacterium alkalicellulosilyticum TaxID=1912214 RepID=UPI0009969E8A|nr:ABC transporter permease [Bacillus alkalicellulosilyticus]
MNFFMRGLLSIIRKKGKSIILFAIIFILGNLIAGAISIQQATNIVEGTVKERLGTAAIIVWDSLKYDEYFNSLSDEEMMNFDYDPENIGVDLIKQVGELKYVKYYDYTTRTSIASNQLESVKDEMNDSNYSVEGYDMDFRLKGTNYAPILDFEEGKSQLVDGRVFTQEELENDSTVAVISKKLAETNNLHVGDSLVLTTLVTRVTDFFTGEQEIYSSRDIVLEVIGIFEPMNISPENARSDRMWYFLDTELQNTIYVSNGIVSSETRYGIEKMMELDKDYAEMMGDREYEDYFEPMFILNSTDDVEAFKEEVMPLLPKFYSVKTATDQYDNISGPIKSMTKFSGYVLIVSIISSILIIGLVVLLFLRDRKRELGIYLSLGESRGRVVGQILIEVMIIALIGIAMSLFTGHLLASGVSDTLMKNNTGSQSNDEFYYYNEIFHTDLSNTDVLDTYQVSLSFTYILLFLGVGLATVLLSTIVPLIYIVRLNPKKILM